MVALLGLTLTRIVLLRDGSLPRDMAGDFRRPVVLTQSLVQGQLGEAYEYDQNASADGVSRTVVSTATAVEACVCFLSF